MGSRWSTHTCWLSSTADAKPRASPASCSPVHLLFSFPPFCRGTVFPRLALKTWSNPALVRRFEELAGFRLVGANGQLLLAGIPSRTFDDIARAVPGLPEPNLFSLDDRPSLAFAPRYEAARFLADLLLLSSNREDPKVCLREGRRA